MLTLRSFVRLARRRLQRALARLPDGLGRFALAALRHGLAAACFGAVHGSFERWPGVVLCTLLGGLLFWVLPRVRPRALARAGELLVHAGAALLILLGFAACMAFVMQALRGAGM